MRRNSSSVPSTLEVASLLCATDSTCATWVGSSLVLVMSCFPDELENDIVVGFVLRFVLEITVETCACDQEEG
jgi:hypothetical protein